MRGWRHEAGGCRKKTLLPSGLQSPVYGLFSRVCSWESSQLPNLADGVRLLALVLWEA
jgi:hypothetical protein